MKEIKCGHNVIAPMRMNHTKRKRSDQKRSDQKRSDQKRSDQKRSDQKRGGNRTKRKRSDRKRSNQKRSDHNKYPSPSVKEFERLKCGPVQQHYFTCYDNDTLHKLRDGWNARHPDARVETNDPTEIWTALKQRFRGVCRNEACWLKQIAGTAAIAGDATFAPEAPKSWIRDPDEWLSSDEIENVMKQYEDKFPAFEFLGPSPSDYSAPKLAGVCVWEELCNFSLKKYADAGTHQIGIIFNTDPHTEDGSHWVSLFINIDRPANSANANNLKGTGTNNDNLKGTGTSNNNNNNYIFFFDSTGDRPQKEIREFIKTVTQQGRSLGIRFKYHENRKQHQKRNTECGMYALFMIVNLIEGTRTPEEFMRGDRIPDSHMLEFRKEYFNQGGSI